jgi:hypothetical protein
MPAPLPEEPGAAELELGAELLGDEGLGWAGVLDGETGDVVAGLFSLGVLGTELGAELPAPGEVLLPAPPAPIDPKFPVP